ncbi:hypothetical protein EHE19_006560 [Ruminiclostridium herbifermentans]|uniref:Uncharacterized protein n=1 Tax=Ruminiclostridium herbifermentans TaxID=2488810 RepID=A0A4U7JD73_9FIRM|nr:hypothetical protein [Ruminiclostridium herbifermentans]QNU68095.1 hypothetical protein EHE19_006560 [Ruminiclostridium herbifermentans]
MFLSYNLSNLIKFSLFINSKDIVYCPVSFKDLTFEALNPNYEETVRGAAECLAQSFAGVEVDGVHISEPMVNALNLSVVDMYEFVYGYLNVIAKQNLCYVAKDLLSGKVVGAIACENFNPDEELPVLEGNIAPINIAFDFLSELDARLVRTIEHKTGTKIRGDEYVHGFMSGATLKDRKRFVIIKLVECLIIDAYNKGYKGIFVEATNPKSVKMSSEYCGFHQVYDIYGEPILGKYAEHPVFNSIPKEIATECCILYRPLNFELDI